MGHCNSVSNTKNPSDIVPIIQKDSVKRPILPSSNSNERVIFEPEPKQTADVLLRDSDGNLYRVHSTFLMHFSLVFNQLDWSSNQDGILMNHNQHVLLAFVKFAYPNPNYVKILDNLSIENLCLLWKLCFQYDTNGTEYCIEKICNLLKDEADETYKCFNCSKRNVTITSYEMYKTVLLTAQIVQNDKILHILVENLTIAGFPCSFIKDMTSKTKDIFLKKMSQKNYISMITA